MALARGRIAITILDGSGTSVSSGHVHVYQYGTTVPITDTLYADKTSGTTLSNPLTTTAAGLAEAWVNMPGTDVPNYVTLAWDDNGGTATPSGVSGSTTQRVEIPPGQERIDYLYDVTKYGAATDGVTSARTAITAAGTALKTAGQGNLYFPTGSYATHGTAVDFDDDTVSNGYVVSGDGWGSRIIIDADQGGNEWIQTLGRHGVGNSYRVRPLLIENLSFYQAARTYKQDIAQLWQAQDVTFRNCVFENIPGMMASLTTCQSVKIDNCVFRSCGDSTVGSPVVAIQLNDEGGTVVGRSTDISITNCRFLTAYDHAIYIWGGQQIRLINNTIDTTSGTLSCGIFLKDCSDVVVANNHINAAVENGIHIQSENASGNILIEGNSISNSGSTGLYTPGAGFGVSVYRANSSQTQSKVTIRNNLFGYQGVNVSGSIRVPFKAEGHQVYGNQTLDTYEVTRYRADDGT